jgi:hypothetical protein
LRIKKNDYFFLKISFGHPIIFITSNGKENKMKKEANSNIALAIENTINDIYSLAYNADPELAKRYYKAADAMQLAKDTIKGAVEPDGKVANWSLMLA